MDIDLHIKLQELVCEHQGNTIGVGLHEEEFIDLLNHGVEDKKLNIPIKLRTDIGYFPGFYHEVQYQDTIFSTVSALELYCFDKKL